MGDGPTAAPLQNVFTERPIPWPKLTIPLIRVNDSDKLHYSIVADWEVSL
jgi:hypothetical protein